MTKETKILVVDDEQVILDSARRILTTEGFAVITTEEASSALRILEAEAPDILLSDLMLPGMSGVELLEAAHEQDPNLVVIITTGYTTVDNAVSSLKKGAFDFLPKPFTFDELLSPVYRAGRFLGLPPGQRRQPPAADAAGYYSLGLQSWARIDKDGAGQLGPAKLFLQTIDEIESIELPEPSTELRQGGRLVRFTTADKLVHQMWSPLSGKVLMANEQLESEPNLPHQDLLASWLVRILPANLEKELPNLSPY